MPSNPRSLSTRRQFCRAGRRAPIARKRRAGAAGKIDDRDRALPAKRRQHGVEHGRCCGPQGHRARAAPAIRRKSRSCDRVQRLARTAGPHRPRSAAPRPPRARRRQAARVRRGSSDQPHQRRGQFADIVRRAPARRHRAAPPPELRPRSCRPPAPRARSLRYRPCRNLRSATAARTDRPLHRGSPAARTRPTPTSSTRSVRCELGNLGLQRPGGRRAAARDRRR